MMLVCEYKLCGCYVFIIVVIVVFTFSDKESYYIRVFVNFAFYRPRNSIYI